MTDETQPKKLMKSNRLTALLRDQKEITQDIKAQDENPSSC